MTRPKFQQERIDREYRDLRALDLAIFTACVHAAEAVGINHDRVLAHLDERDRLALLADIEQHLVSIAVPASKAGGR